MKKHVGESFEGVVSSVAKFGLFVLLREFDVDGRVALEDLGNDKWVFDEENLHLVGKRSGQIYQIGDRLSVTVANVDLFEGKEEWLHLAVLLRLAVVLRRSRLNQHLPHIDVQASDGALLLRLPKEWLDKHPLTRLDLAQEASYLKVVPLTLNVEEV